jgi:hypothetical protein
VFSTPFFCFYFSCLPPPCLYPAASFLLYNCEHMHAELRSQYEAGHRCQSGKAGQPGASQAHTAHWKRQLGTLPAALHALPCGAEATWAGLH